MSIQNHEYSQNESLKRITQLQQQIKLFPRFDQQRYLKLAQHFRALEQSQPTQLRILAFVCGIGCFTQEKKFIDLQHNDTQFREVWYSNMENLCLSIKYGIASSLQGQMIRLKKIIQSGKQLFLLFVIKNCLYGIAKVSQVDFTRSFKYWNSISFQQGNRQNNHDLEKQQISLVGIVKIKFYALGCLQNFKNQTRIISHLLSEIKKGYIPLEKFKQADLIQEYNRNLEIKLIRNNRITQIQQLYKSKAQSMQNKFQQYSNYKRQNQKLNQKFNKEQW